MNWRNLFRRGSRAGRTITGNKTRRAMDQCGWRALGLEPLEERTLLTVDITSVYDGINATFTGDGGNDPLQLSVFGPDLTHNLNDPWNVAHVGLYASNTDFDPTAGVGTIPAATAGLLGIDLAGGTNSVTLGASLGTAILNWNNTGGANTFVGPNLVNFWNVTVLDTGTLNGTYGFANVGNLTGGPLFDVFQLVGGTLTGAIDGGVGGLAVLTGDNVANTWTVTGADAGTATGVAGGFTNVGFLVGGTAADGFTLAGGTLSGSIDGGAGPGQNTLTGDNVANTWTVTGADAGTATGVSGGFANVGFLIGGTNTDDFTLAGGTLSGSINGGGGGGANSLTGDNVPNTWTVTGANIGMATGVAGGFFNIGSLTGGTVADTFALTSPGNGLSGQVNGGGGADLLDYSAYGAGSPVTVDFVAGTATDLGSVANVENFLGSGGADTVDVAPLAGGVARDMDDAAGGGTLNVDALGLTVTVTATTLSFSGGFGNITYSGWTDLNITNAASMVVEGTAAAETLTLQRNGGVDLGRYSWTGAAPWITFAGPSFTFNGQGDDDTMIVDYVGGAPILSGGISFNGGAQTTGDRLTIQNGSFTTVTYNATGIGAGNVDLDGETITFTGLEPVAILPGPIGTLNINITDGLAHNITLQDDGNPNDGISEVVIDGGLESATFTNPTTLILNTAVGAGDAGRLHNDDRHGGRRRRRVVHRQRLAGGHRGQRGLDRHSERRHLRRQHV